MKWYQMCLLSVACSLPMMTYAVEDLSPLQARSAVDGLTNSEIQSAVERYEQSNTQNIPHISVLPRQVATYASAHEMTINEGESKVLSAGDILHAGNIVIENGGQLILENGSGTVYANSLQSQGGKIVVSEGSTLYLHLDEVPESLFNVHIAGTLNLQPQSGEAIIITPKGQPLIAQDFSFQAVQLHDENE